MEGDYPTLENTAHLDGLLCMGSDMSAYEDAPWMLELGEVFKSVENTSLKIVGVCFGHHLINKVFGGEVARNVGQGTIIGADKIKISIPEDLLGSAISGLLEDGTTLNMLECHGDEVVSLGQGARRLGSSKRCENEIVLVRDNILTMQGHPNFTAHTMMEIWWTYLLKKGEVDPADRGKAEAEMTELDTDKILDVVRAFFKG